MIEAVQLRLVLLSATVVCLGAYLDAAPVVNNERSQQQQAPIPDGRPMAFGQKVTRRPYVPPKVDYSDPIYHINARAPAKLLSFHQPMVRTAPRPELAQSPRPREPEPYEQPPPNLYDDDDKLPFSNLDSSSLDFQLPQKISKKFNDKNKKRSQYKRLKATKEQRRLKKQLLKLAKKAAAATPPLDTPEEPLLRFNSATNQFERVIFDPRAQSYQEKLQKAIKALSAKQLPVGKLRALLSEEEQRQHDEQEEQEEQRQDPDGDTEVVEDPLYEVPQAQEEDEMDYKWPEMTRLNEEPAQIEQFQSGPEDEVEYPFVPQAAPPAPPTFQSQSKPVRPAVSLAPLNIEHLKPQEFQSDPYSYLYPESEQSGSEGESESESEIDYPDKLDQELGNIQHADSAALTEPEPELQLAPEPSFEAEPHLEPNYGEYENDFETNYQPELEPELDSDVESQELASQQLEPEYEFDSAPTDQSDSETSEFGLLGSSDSDDLGMELSQPPTRPANRLRELLDDRLDRVSDLLYFRPEHMHQLLQMDDKQEALTPLESEFKRMVLCNADEQFCEPQLSEATGYEDVMPQEELELDQGQAGATMPTFQPPSSKNQAEQKLLPPAFPKFSPPQSSDLRRSQSFDAVSNLKPLGQMAPLQPAKPPAQQAPTVMATMQPKQATGAPPAKLAPPTQPSQVAPPKATADAGATPAASAHSSASVGPSGRPPVFVPPQPVAPLLVPK